MGLLDNGNAVTSMRNERRFLANMIVEIRRAKVEETRAIGMDDLPFGSLLAGLAAEGLGLTITRPLSDMVVY